jgi:hypothetical protein
MECSIVATHSGRLSVQESWKAHYSDNKVNGSEKKVECFLYER